MYGMIKCVRKRSGQIQDFDLAKLERTIFISIQEEKEFDEPYDLEKITASRITFEVINALERKIRNKEVDCMCVDMDVIQDAVEDIFYSSGYHNTAKNYMRYKFDKQLSKKNEEIERLKKENKELLRFKETYIDDIR